ncbi:MAG: hypothetical protein AAFP19_26575, partial [Bacteroidota bacterium]
YGIPDCFTIIVNGMPKEIVGAYPEIYFMRTMDSGATWSDNHLAGIPHIDYLRFTISPDNSNVIYAEDNINMNFRCPAKSTDVGLNFSPMINEQNHVDSRIFFPYNSQVNDPSGNNDVIFLGNDGGVSKTTDGQRWIDITGEGLNCTNFYGIGITESNSDMIIGGAQDGSINFYNDGVWYETRPGGDNGDCLINPANSALIFQEVNSNVRRTTDVLSTTNSGLPATPPGKRKYIYPLYNNPNDADEIYAATDNLQVYSISSASWTTVADANIHPNKQLSSIAMSVANNDIVYYSVHGHWWNNNQPSTHENNYGGLIKADRSSGSWVLTDITGDMRDKCQGTDCGLSVPIVDITVDPDDEDNIWVVFSRFNANQKVYHSEDGGASWVSETSCLPNIPITSICFQRGTDNRVYIGTDFGVFFKDDTMSDWAFYGNEGPRTLVADMEISTCANKLVVATQGAGLWEVDLLKGNDIIIPANQSVVWDQSRWLTGDLYIKPGATLHILNSTISIAKDVRIFVEERGHLIVDNSVLTNNCNEFWEGIEVWGDAALSQSFIGQSQEQGFLEVMNNSTIEYARNAVKLGKTGDSQLNHTGGLIWARNSTFRNNIQAVEFLKYRNFSPFNPSFTLWN